MPDYYVAFVTVPDAGRAEALARTVVEESLAAQASVLPGLSTLRRGKTRVEQSAGSLVVMHTERVKLEALRARVVAVHPDAQPDFVVVDVAAGHTPHLRWVLAAITGRL